MSSAGSAASSFPASSTGSLFDGEHTLRVEPRNGGSRFTQSEKFNGLLVPLLGGSLAKTNEGFRRMNAALKERAERR